MIKSINSTNKLGLNYEGEISIELYLIDGRRKKKSGGMLRLYPIESSPLEQATTIVWASFHVENPGTTQNLCCSISNPRQMQKTISQGVWSSVTNGYNSDLFFLSQRILSSGDSVTAKESQSNWVSDLVTLFLCHECSPPTVIQECCDSGEWEAAIQRNGRVSLKIILQCGLTFPEK